VSVERQFVRKDGSSFWGYLSGRRHVNSEGRLISLIGYLTDISDLKQSEEERLSLERQLLRAQKLDSLGLLAGGIAHDFNNILTAIMGNISYAKKELDLSHQAYEPLVRAEKAAKRAAGLARQLLTFAKGGEPVKKYISLPQTVQETLSLVLSGTNVQAAVNLAPDLQTLYADEGQISQAFHNIIINAVQAMPSGGTLAVSARNIAISGSNSFGLPAGEYVRISFEDEGCGIAPEIMERIFDPYFTSKEGGSGLGLASTYSIIKKHDGHISVSSSYGKGAIFNIILPGFDRQVAEEISAAPVSDNIKEACSILVMDDDEMVRELAVISIKRLGYKVVCCEDGLQAVSLYRAAYDVGAPYHLVIMDLTIPGRMGGVKAAQEILAIDPAARMIVSSGYSKDPVMANFSDYGFCAALEKPYNIDEIARILQGTTLNSAEQSCPSL
jgi:signal transduction histidine kinase/ActR/RegA family two-component response regulator